MFNKNLFKASIFSCFSQNFISKISVRLIHWYILYTGASYISEKPNFCSIKVFPRRLYFFFLPKVYPQDKRTSYTLVHLIYGCVLYHRKTKFLFNKNLFKATIDIFPQNLYPQDKRASYTLVHFIYGCVLYHRISDQ